MSRLDRDVRVPSLPAGRCPPGVQALLGEPDGEITSPSEAGLVLTPVPHPISRLRILVLGALWTLHQVWLRVGDGIIIKPNREPCTNAQHTQPDWHRCRSPTLVAALHWRHLHLLRQAGTDRLGDPLHQKRRADALAGADGRVGAGANRGDEVADSWRLAGPDGVA